jgi:hypothetical protein
MPITEGLSGADVSTEPGTSSHVTTPEPDLRTDMRAMLRSAGINVTDEGMERARKLLREAEAKRTPEMRAAWRKQLGLPEDPE